MNRFVRWMVIVIFSMTFAFFASEQGNGVPAAAAAGSTSSGGWHSTPVGGGIVHYWIDMPVGPGQFDVIRVHRVVNDAVKNHSSKGPDAVMMLPGEPTTFEALYLSPSISTAADWDHAIAVYLAKNGIDVWGVDYAWALVPLGTADFSFMKQWGVAKDIGHIRAALRFARLIRSLTDPDAGPMYVLGLSYGGMLTYGVAGKDVEQHPFERNVKGIINLEGPVVWKDKAARDTSCSGAAAAQDMIKSGFYSNDTGAWCQMLGYYAENKPNGHDMDPSVTNRQLSLMVAAMPNFDPVNWHFLGSYFDSGGMPAGLRFTDEQLWNDMLQTMPPHYPQKLDVDLGVEGCSKDDPLDFNFQRITVPILYVGGAGGIGRYGEYATTRTASKDITKLIVQLLPDAERMMDYGHGDLVAADNAEALVWKPILRWITAHR